jgi:hypothetical protein
MPQAIVWIFLASSSLFAAVHNFALATSLYWYYWWFDVLMHFWGGILVVIGVYALCSLKHIPLRPTSLIIFTTLVIVMILWEIFEWRIGLFNPQYGLFDTIKDLLVGLSGGLVGYFAALRLKMYQ